MLGKDLLKCDMGNEKYLMVKDIENNVYLTLVSYDMDLPSYLRGCRLTASHLVMLVMNELVIDEHLKEVKKGNEHVRYAYHFGNGFTCCISPFLQTVTLGIFNMRNSARARPNWQGIVLRIAEWECIKSKFDVIRSVSPVLSNAKPSYINYIHNECECMAWCPYTRIGLIECHSDAVHQMDINLSTCRISE